jgi:superoxide dismutase, Cu-Zn family
MRTRIRSRAVGVGVTLAIGLLIAMAVPAGACGVGRTSAFTPNPSFVPSAGEEVNPAAGAMGRVGLVVAGRRSRTLVMLHVEGLPSGRSFGAHLHRDACASAFGGPHYQAPDPAHPVAANADTDHEVWLDFTTNADGRGRAQAVVPFVVQPGPRSVVIHQADHTMPGGTAGQRLACLDITV